MPRHKRNRSSQRKAAEPVRARSALHEHVALALVLLLTLVAYLPALRGTPLWDDDAHLTAPELQSLGGLGRIWFQLGATQQYYPLLHSAFWLEHRLWGDSVVGYHLVNVIWHMFAVALVYAILTRLKIPGALLAAAIFGLHPVMVESVAWITEQKNTLSGVFYLCAMLAYLEFDESRRPAHYLSAIGFFVLGLLTKTVTASLPAALLVIFWWRRGVLSWRRDAWPLLPFFVLGGLGGLMTAWVERTQLGAHGADFDLGPLSRCLLAGRVIWFYLGKLFWPTNLTFIYPRWTIEAAEPWQWIFPLSVLALTIALWTLRSRSRALLAGWLYFCGTLFPALGFVNVYPFIFSYVADHFQYLASLGIIVPVAAGVADALATASRRVRATGIIGSIMVVGAFALLTARQSSLYAKPVSLYEATLERNPACWMAHNNLGVQLAGQGDQTGAIAHYRVAIKLKPNYFEAHNNLGDALTREGQLREATQEFRIALEQKPDFFNAYNNLGHALTLAGQDVQAVASLESALKLNPDHPVALNNIGLALVHLRRYDDAIGYLEDALEVQPNFSDAHNTLGMALASAGRIAPAIEHFQTAIRLKPNYLEAYDNLARTLLAANRFDEAVDVAQHGIIAAHSAADEMSAKRIDETLRAVRQKRQEK